jgi:galactonate dehydratase
MADAGLGVGGGAAEPDAAPAATATAVDSVRSFELFKVPPRWLFLRVETAHGVVGWGEPNVEGFSDTVAAAVTELMGSVVGEDPARIQYIWQKLYRQKFYTGGPILMSAMAGIDQALWDIAGKTLGVPVHQMLGGAVRERLKAYRWCGGDENSPAESAAEAKAVIEGSNYRQLKMNACPRMGYIDTEQAVEAAAERFAAVRAAVGPEVGVGLDFHGRVKLPMAKKLMAALAPHNPLFFEEVLVHGQNPALHAQISGRTDVPLATVGDWRRAWLGCRAGSRADSRVPATQPSLTMRACVRALGVADGRWIVQGERMYTVEEFRDLFETRAVNIVQPDCSHAGGISHMLTIARMAEAYEVSFGQSLSHSVSRQPANQSVSCLLEGRLSIGCALSVCCWVCHPYRTVHSPQLQAQQRR